jgi:hypothetical protein
MKQESGYVNAFDLSKNPEIGAAVAAVATGSADKEAAEKVFEKLASTQDRNPPSWRRQISSQFRKSS